MVLPCLRIDLKEFECNGNVTGTHPSKCEMSAAHRNAVEFLSRSNLGTMEDGRYELGDGTVAKIAQVMLRPCSEATYETDSDHDTMIFLFSGEDGAFTTKTTSIEHVWNLMGTRPRQ